MQVIFNKPVAHDRIIYKPGQIAKFSDPTAMDLITRGICRPCDPPIAKVMAEGQPEKKTASTSTPSSSSQAAPRSRTSKSTKSKNGTKKKVAKKSAAS